MVKNCHQCGGHVIIAYGNMWSNANFCSTACIKKYREKIEREAKEESEGNILYFTLHGLRQVKEGS